MTQLHHRRRMVVVLFALLAAIVISVVVVGCVVSAKQQAAPAPAPQPVAVVQPWCINPVSMTVLDDDECTRDDDFDGFIDGHLLVPDHRWVKPAKGGKLPPEVKLDPAGTLKIPVRVNPRPKPSATMPAKPAGPSAPKTPAGRRFGR